MAENIGILISSKINEEESIRTINTQLTTMGQKINKLNLSVDLSKMEQSFDKIFKSIDSINKLTEQLNKANIQHEEILKKVGTSTQNIVKSNQQVTESIKEQNKALREQDGLAQRQLKYNSEGKLKNRTDTYKYGNITEVETYSAKDELLGRKVVNNIEKENKEINKLLQERAKLQQDLELFKREAENVKLRNIDRRYGLENVDQQKLAEYLTAVRSLNMETPNLRQKMKELNLQFRELGESVQESGSHTLKFSDSMLTALKRFPVWALTAELIYAPVRAMQEAVSVIIEVDTAITDLKKVMNEDTNFSGMLQKATDDAKNLGQTITDVLASYNEFAKQGYNEEETRVLGKSAIVASNVSGDLNAQQSAEFLTSALIQFKLEATKSMEVVDKWNELANNFPTTFNNLARGVARAGSVAKSFGMDIDELNAIIGTTTAVTKQSGDEIGNFVKFVLPRLQSDDSKTALKDLGVSMTDQNGEMRNAFDIYSDVAKALEGISDAERNMIAETLAGKHHISRFIAMMENWDMVEQQLASSMDSKGSAMKENETYMQSLEAKINQLKARFQELAIRIGEAFLSDGMMLFFEGIGKGVELMTTLVEQFGFLPMAIGAITTAMIGLKAITDSSKQSAFDFIQSAMGTGSNPTKQAQDVAESMSMITTATNKTKTSFSNLKGVAVGSLKAIGGALPQMALLMGLGFAIEKITSTIQKEKEALEKRKKELKDSAKSYKENKDEIKSLVSKYEELDNIRKSKGLNIEQEREYYNIQKKLVELMPSLKDGENSKGDARAKSVEATKESIKAQQEYLKLLEEEKYLKADKKINKYRGSIDETRFGKGWDVLRLRDTALTLNDISGGKWFAGTKNDADQEVAKIQEDTAKAIRAKVSYQKELNKNQKEYIKNLAEGLLFEGKSTKETEDKAEKIAKLFNKYGKDASYIFGDQFKSDEILGFSNKQIDALEQVIKSINKGKLNYDDFEKTLKKAGFSADNVAIIIRNLKNAHDENRNSIDDEIQSTNTLIEKIKELEGNANLLGSAQKELDETGRLSTDTLQKMIDKYPDLISVTGLERDAIYEFIGAKNLESAESIKAEKEKTNNKIVETKKRLETMKTELTAMQEMMMAEYIYQDKNGIYKKTKKAKGKKYKEDVNEIQGLYGAQQKAEANLKKLEDQSKLLDYAQGNLSKSFNDASGATEQAEKATEEYQKTQEEANEVVQESIFILNQYEEKLRVIDNALRKVQTTQNRYAKSSELYRNSIKQEINLIEQKINALKQQEAQLNSDVKNGTIHPYGVVSKNIFGSNAGVTGSIGSTGFDKRITSNYGMRGGKMHHGIDLAYGGNEPINSNINGTVVYSGWGQQGSGYGGYGNVVAVRDNSGNVHLYAHMNKVNVSKGQTIKQGDLLGLAGNTGNSQGNHLHYEIRKNGQLKNTINPINYVQGFGAKNTQTSGGISGVKYADIINQASAKYGVPSNILAGLIQTESGFNPNAKSYAGAMGLTQLMPGTAKSLGVSNAYDPYQNIMGGANYLAQMISRFGNVRDALSAYNMGPGNQSKGKTNYSYADKVLGYANRYGGIDNQYNGSVSQKELPFNEWYSSEADYQSALHDAKVQADEIGVTVEELYTQLAELEYKIVESRIAEYEKAIEKYDIDLNYWEKMAEGVSEYSLKGLSIMGEELTLIDKKKNKYQEIMGYIQSEISNNNKLNDFYRDELSNSYNSYLREFREMEAMYLQIERKRQTIQFENYYKTVEERLNYLKKEISKIDSQISMTEEDNLAEIIKLSKEKYIIAEKENKYIGETIQSLRQQYDIYKDNYELADNINEKIKQWEDNLDNSNLELYNIQKNIKSLYENLAEKLINQMKSYYQTIKDREQQMYDERKKKMQEEHEKRMENLDKEMTKYEKYAQMQIQTMERAEQQESYEKQLQKMQDERQKIQNLYNELLMDTSLEGEKRRKELAEDLKNRDEEITDFMKNRESELIKRDINDRLEKERETYNTNKENAQKKYEEDVKKVEEEQKERVKYWQYLIDSEREWNKIREQIVQGDLDSVQRNVETFKQNVEKLSKTTVDNLEVVIDGLNGKISVMTDGMSLAIQENLIDQLKETIDLMNEIEGRKLGGYNDLSGIQDKITPITQDDLNLMVGKFIMGELYRSADNTSDKNKFEQLANSYIAKAGGKSKFNDMDYRDIVGKLSNEEKLLFAKYLQQNSSGITGDFYKSMVNSYVNDMIGKSSFGQAKSISNLKFDDAFKQYLQLVAQGKIAKFDNGGYTGNWDGGYGKLAVLHPKELILNEDNTTTLLDTLKEIKNIKPIINKIKAPKSDILNNFNQVMNVNMHIDKLTGDEAGAKKFLKAVTNGLKGKGVVKFV